VKNRRSSIIPPDVAAKVQFLSNRTCCVCRKAGKPVQLHHIDSDPTNNDIENLAVLCLDCHMQTLVSGGFYRKLDASQVKLYRDDWLNIVEKQRARKMPSRAAPAEPPTQMYWSNRPGGAQRVRAVALARPLEAVSVNIIDDPEAVIRFKREWLPEAEGLPRKNGIFPILEISLKNGTDEAVPLKRLELEVKNARITYDPASYHTPPVSWEYNVLLNPHQPGARKSLKLPQEIGAGQSGRLIIIIGQLSGYGELKYADYELHLELFYNGEQCLDLGIHKIRVPSPPLLLLGKERAIRYLKF
jgi:hypothetical protein